MATEHTPSEDAPRVISCDVWQTLLTPNPEVHEHRATRIAKLVGCASTATVMKVIQAINRQYEISEHIKGQRIGRTERAIALLQVLDKRQLKPSQPLARRSPEPEPLGELIGPLIDIMQQTTLECPPALAEPELPETLARFRAHGRAVVIAANLGFLTNRQLMALLEPVGLAEQIDCFATSDDIPGGAAKPNHTVFKVAGIRAGHPVERMVHLGTHTTADYLAAIRAGAQAVLLGPPRPEVRTASSIRNAAQRGYLGADLARAFQ